MFQSKKRKGFFLHWMLKTHSSVRTEIKLSLLSILLIFPKWSFVTKHKNVSELWEWNTEGGRVD